jgi:THUMP domain-like
MGMALPKSYLDALSTPEVQSYIADHESTDEKELILKHRTLFGIPSSAIAVQITGRRVAKRKIPSYYRQKGIVYPPSANLAQSSSEQTARFKTKCLRLYCDFDLEGKSGVDLTGGFGVDSFFLSEGFAAWDFVEPDEPLLEIARHNHQLLGRKKIRHIHSPAEKIIPQADFAFIDPSRRIKNKKVFRLADCVPSMAALTPVLRRKTEAFLIKASPLIDLQQGIKELNCVHAIFVVSHENECKEVLFFCRPVGNPDPKVFCIDLNMDGDPKFEFLFHLSHEKSEKSVLSDPLTFLYEPGAAILKAGAFKSVGMAFGLRKLGISTHVYTSERCDNRFPGRIFRIEKINPDPGELDQYFPGRKANVMTRNYPLSPDQLKKKLKLHDGGEKYLIGFSGVKKKFIVTAERIK